MSKRQLIADIRRFNTTVEPRFLTQFDKPALQQYLGLLQNARQIRPRFEGWIPKRPKLRMVF